MLHSSKKFLYEKSNDIPIKNNSYVKKNMHCEHSLKQNLFDPSKSSPPNEFIQKLHARISAYNYNYNYNVNVDSFKSE